VINVKIVNPKNSTVKVYKYHRTYQIKAMVIPAIYLKGCRKGYTIIDVSVTTLQSVLRVHAMICLSVKLS